LQRPKAVALAHDSSVLTSPARTYRPGPDTDPAVVVAEGHRRLGVDEAIVLEVLAQAKEKSTEMARVFN